MNRVAIFIDGSNLYRGLVSTLGPEYRLDFVAFVSALAAGRPLLRAYYYNAPLPSEDPAAKAHQSFLNYLRRAPYVTVRLGRLERRGETFVEKGVDIQIATDMLKLAYAHAYDVAILVSGDADFAEVFKVLQDMGKQVENTTFQSLSSYRLAQQADRYYPLDHLPWEQLRARSLEGEELAPE
ncbi:NYN domain-containing protein [Meiothermus sp. QL-1]|uniref:LabA-like NYN domain-containing protein n=1 Tax=Meiothermus sp. QL-1 TaxID=2058095 RepID=UPI000E0B9791|nr:NYN domain-containing protein [Meiothermus sp. QL-1]RDI96132.1 NYN domain-containing protein [Meiothermus sp. QL-1]